MKQSLIWTAITILLVGVIYFALVSFPECAHDETMVRSVWAWHWVCVKDK
jgi:hypothetical protein